MLLRPAEVVVLAGGVARRMAPLTMGSPKALLRFSANETFLDHLLAVYRRAGIERATVVWSHSARLDSNVLQYLAHPQYISLKIRHEFHADPDANRMDSVLRGVRHAEGTSSIFLQDVDRPFLTTNVLMALLANEEGEGYAAPDISGHAGHPLLLSPRLVSVLRNLHDSRNLILREVLQPFPCTLVRVATAEKSALLDININTPAEYHRHFTFVVKERKPVPA